MKKATGKILSRSMRGSCGFGSPVSGGSDRVRKVNARVISIAISPGWHGKTPLVIRIAKEIAAEGKKVAVLTRGYGKDEVKELQKNFEHSGDRGRTGCIRNEP